MLNNNGRVVMISGANRGIGLAIARNLYKAGYSLSLGSRSIDSLKGIIENSTEDRIINCYFDANDKSSHKNWVIDTVNKFSKIDCLINNAGIVESVSVDDEEDNEEALDRMWAVNVKAPLSLTRLTLPYLKKSGSGRVINVASLAGKAVYGSSVGYSMTKFAAVALSHATRHGGWDYGVRCTALCPGYVATDMTSEVESVPIDNMISPTDLAELVKTVISLSNSASVAELIVNCKPDIIA
jgi:NADP-dependent 3-hydroxy acid dehydrogenase YdfG